MKPQIIWIPCHDPKCRRVECRASRGSMVELPDPEEERRERRCDHLAAIFAVVGLFLALWFAR